MLGSVKLKWPLTHDSILFGTFQRLQIMPGVTSVEISDSVIQLSDRRSVFFYTQNFKKTKKTKNL